MTIDIEGMKRVVELSDRCSLLYWWPRIKDLGIPVPRTEVVEIPSDVLLKAPFEPELLEPYMDRVYEAARRIGYPLFLRSDQLSGKHDWAETCYVPSEDVLFSHIIRVLEWHHLAQVIPIPARALVFREFLELDWAFRAFKGLPVARERRYFIKDGEVLCHHPYWPEEAIRECEWSVDKPNWRELLAELNRETPEEVELLTGYSLRVAEVMDGFWSIDYARARDGTWYLIDMAVGEISWHPPGCPYARLSGMRPEQEEGKRELSVLLEFLSNTERDEEGGRA